MRRRGPDARGALAPRTAPAAATCICCSPGSRIIDLDPRANQPFACRRRHAVLNGELYNYLELRAALERAGTRLRTTSRHRGPGAGCWRTTGRRGSPRCEGMWGFAWFDRGDRPADAGARPVRREAALFYRDGDGLYFGSEVKFLFAAAGPAPARQRRPPQALLVNGYKALYKTGRLLPRPQSVRPGCWLGVDATGRVERMAVLAADASRPAPTSMSYEEAVAGTRERLIRSVELRLRADVPLAFCLSGGVDSPRADRHRQARARLRRARLHHHEHRRALRGARHGGAGGARAGRAPHRRFPSTRRTSCPTCASWCASTTRRSTPSPTTRNGS